LDAEARCANRNSEAAPQPALTSVVPPPDNTILLKSIKDLSRHVATLSAVQDIFAPASGTFASAPGTLAPAAGITAPAPGNAVRAADPLSEMKLHSPTAGIIVASESERRKTLNISQQKYDFHEISLTKNFDLIHIYNFIRRS
jgi:hypothetical protein